VKKADNKSHPSKGVCNFYFTICFYLFINIFTKVHENPNKVLINFLSMATLGIAYRLGVVPIV
jgi:hypothetical protein